MSGKYTILVTGVGAIIGYGIINSLRKSCYDCKIIGIDIYDDSIGRIWCDHFVQGMRADDPSFTKFIVKLVEQFNIDLIIPGIEQDIQALNNMRQRLSELNVVAVLNKIDCLSTFSSKARTSHLLNKLDLPALNTVEAKSSNKNVVLNTIGLPCLAKLDQSYACKGQAVIHDEHELEYYLSQSGYLIQEYIHGVGVAEFTASVFALGDGSYVNLIILQRVLGPDGATHKAKVVENAAIAAQVEQLCQFVTPLGPTNFQFIYAPKQDVYYLLEVNPRISSSTSLRTAFGINEAQMCIQYFLHRQIPDKATIRKGTAQRYIMDFIEYDSATI